jgi:hypothetical protein
MSQEESSLMKKLNQNIVFNSDGDPIGVQLPGKKYMWDAQYDSALGIWHAGPYEIRPIKTNTGSVLGYIASPERRP